MYVYVYRRLSIPGTNSIALALPTYGRIMCWFWSEGPFFAAMHMKCIA